ncbi:hypothetical protein V8B97DRAFT_1918004 [Scleroderma yunnanense]
MALVNFTKAGKVAGGKELLKGAAEAIEDAMTAWGSQGYMEEAGIGGYGFLIFSGKRLNAILNSRPARLGALQAMPLKVLLTAVHLVYDAYRNPTTPSPLIFRSALMSLGYIAVDLTFLEHATWSVKTRGMEGNVDVEVFRRWTIGGGLNVPIEEVRLSKAHGEA